MAIIMRIFCVGLLMADSVADSTISKILVLQILIVVLVASGFFLMGSWQQVISSTLGGLTAFLPNLYFALKVSSSSGGDAKKIVRSFYVGESGKLILTALLFYGIFQVPDIELMPVMVGFVATLSVFWFALIMRG